MLCRSGSFSAMRLFYGIEGAELIVIAKRSPEYTEPLRQLSYGPRVIDLASLFAGGAKHGETEYEGICW
jgi:hypothetical protein